MGAEEALEELPALVERHAQGVVESATRFSTVPLIKRALLEMTPSN